MNRSFLHFVFICVFGLHQASLIETEALSIGQVGDGYTKDQLISWEQSAAVTIPFTLNHGIPIVRLIVNGHDDALFLIDSGSQQTLLNRDEAAHFGVEVSKQEIGIVPGTSDSFGVPFVKAMSIRIKSGRTSLIKGDVPSVSLAELGNMLQIRVAGIIGYDYLRSQLTVIDYNRGVLAIFADKKKSAFKVPGSASMFNVDKNGILPVFSADVAIDGNSYGKVRALLDTGSERSALVSSSFGKTHGLRELKGWTVQSSYGLGGESDVLHGLSGSIAADQGKIMLPDISLSLASSGLSNGGLYDLLVGQPAIAKSCLVFDVRNGAIYLI